MNLIKVFSLRVLQTLLVVLIVFPFSLYISASRADRLDYYWPALVQNIDMMCVAVIAGSIGAFAYDMVGKKFSWRK